MIVSCGSCLTKFRLDDAKISAKGTKVRCSRCQHIFLVMPPPVMKEEILEDVKSFGQWHEPLIEPDQNKVEVEVEFCPPFKTEETEKAGNEETRSSYKETFTKNTGQMVLEKAVKLERIKVKTFKIDENSFSIEWNMQNKGIVWQDATREDKC